MKRWEKIVGCLAIILFVAALGIVYWGFSTQKSWRETEKTISIWLPENYQLLNKRAGTYTSLIEVQLKGKVSYISLKDFQQAFNNATVAIGSRGRITYWNDEGKITVAASDQLWLDGNYASEIQMLSDNNIRLVRDTTFGNALLSFCGIFGMTILSLPIGLVSDKVYCKIRTKNLTK
jgi:hypothetical protein